MQCMCILGSSASRTYHQELQRCCLLWLVRVWCSPRPPRPPLSSTRYPLGYPSVVTGGCTSNSSNLTGPHAGLTWRGYSRVRLVVYPCRVWRALDARNVISTLSALSRSCQGSIKEPWRRVESICVLSRILRVQRPSIIASDKHGYVSEQETREGQNR